MPTVIAMIMAITMAFFMGNSQTAWEAEQTFPLAGNN